MSVKFPVSECKSYMQDDNVEFIEQHMLTVMQHKSFLLLTEKLWFSAARQYHAKVCRHRQLNLLI